MGIDNWYEAVLWISTILQIVLMLPLIVRSSRVILSAKPNQPYWRADLAVTMLMIGIVFRSIAIVNVAYKERLTPDFPFAVAAVYVTVAELGVLFETMREGR